MFSWHPVNIEVYSARLIMPENFKALNCHYDHQIHNMVLLQKGCVGFNDSSTHWGRITNICVSKLATLGPDHGLSPGILLIGLPGTNFSEISIKIQNFSFKKMHLKMSSAKWRPFSLSLNVLSVSVPHGYGTRNMLSQFAIMCQAVRGTVMTT